jgi:H+/gluconate symporter-like permease
MSYSLALQVLALPTTNPIFVHVALSVNVQVVVCFGPLLATVHLFTLLAVLLNSHMLPESGQVPLLL